MVQTTTLHDNHCKVRSHKRGDPKKPVLSFRHHFRKLSPFPAPAILVCTHTSCLCRKPRCFRSRQTIFNTKWVFAESQRPLQLTTSTLFSSADPVLLLPFPLGPGELHRQGLAGRSGNRRRGGGRWSAADGTIGDTAPRPPPRTGIPTVRPPPHYTPVARPSGP